MPLHAKVGLQDGHFKRWLALWFETVDDLYAGERANLAKVHALVSHRRSISGCRHSVAGRLSPRQGSSSRSTGRVSLSACHPETGTSRPTSRTTALAGHLHHRERRALGSISPAKRPIGMSIGSEVIVAPSSRALATIASQSATAKHTPQCGGTSGGNYSSVICIMPPTGFPSTSQTV